MTSFDLAVERLVPWLAQSSARTIVLIAVVALAMALWRRARPSERLTLWRWVLCAAIVLPLSASWLPGHNCAHRPGGSLDVLLPAMSKVKNRES